jgi:hypothetical protein
MIQDVDETLRALLKREALNGSQVEIAFDAPTRDWAARRNAPVINLYLYDIREDMSRRESGYLEIRADEGYVTSHAPFPRRYKLSYLLTAWTQRPEDEHHLLSACLGSLIRHDAMGPEEMEGALAEQPLPAYVTVALPLGPDRSIADIWSALGGEMKPSLDVVVTAPFVVSREEKVGPPVREVPRLTVARPDTEEAERVARARPDIVEAERVARLRSRREARGARTGPLRPDEPITQDETVVGGTKGKPGRIFRVRGHSRP